MNEKLTEVNDFLELDLSSLDGISEPAPHHH